MRVIAAQDSNYCNIAENGIPTATATTFSFHFYVTE